MKTKRMKNKIIFSLLTIALAMLSIASISTAYAAENAFDIASVKPVMQKGAFVRVPDEDYAAGGLRYVMQISSEEYNSILQNTGEGKALSSVQFGIFIAPSYYHEAFPLNSESNVSGENAKYGWITAEDKANGLTYDETEAGLAGRYRIINTESDSMSDNGDGLHLFKGSVINMKEQNMLTEYTCAGYIRYTDANGVHYVFAEQNDNARSMTYVAQLAVENEADTEDGILNSTYIEPFKNTSVKYKENHYVQNDNGEYVLDTEKSAEKTANLGAKISAESISYEGKRIAKTNGYKDEGIAYANDKAVLSFYYRDESIMFDGSDRLAFYNGGSPGELSMSIIEENNDNVLLIEDIGSNTFSTLIMPSDITRSALVSSEYDYVNFRMKAATAVTFFPYNNNGEHGNISLSIKAGEWQIYTIAINHLAFDLAKADYCCFWASNTGYKVYVSDIYLTKDTNSVEGMIEDFEMSYVSTTLSGATDRGASTSVIDDPTESGRGKVYKWNTTAGSWNKNSSWTNIANLVTKAKSLGYDYLAVDIYANAVSTDKVTIHINGWKFMPTAVNTWQTVKVALDSAVDDNLMWADAAGYVLFDNFRFTKYDPIIFDGEKQDITLSSTHTSKPVIEVVESGEEAHGKVYSYSHTSSIHDQLVSISGIDALIKTAKLFGYTKLSIDVKYTSESSLVTILGVDFKPSKANEWETKVVELTSLTGTSTFWLSSAGAILLDNITFVK